MAITDGRAREYLLAVRSPSSRFKLEMQLLCVLIRDGSYRAIRSKLSNKVTSDTCNS